MRPTAALVERLVRICDSLRFATLQLDRFTVKRTAGFRLRQSGLHGKFIVITIPVRLENEFRATVNVLSSRSRVQRSILLSRVQLSGPRSLPLAYCDSSVWYQCDPWFNNAIQSPTAAFEPRSPVPTTPSRGKECDSFRRTGDRAL